MGNLRLTQLDREIWAYIWERFERQLGCPSITEISQATFCSPPKVSKALDKLELREVVTWLYIGDARRAARGCLSVKPPSDEPPAKVEDAMAKMEREREAARLRMRNLRAKRRGTLTNVF